MTLTLPTTSTPDVDAPPAQDPAHPLKLSEAIRLGAMVTKQLHGAWGDASRTCGIGAAQVALGLPVGSHGPLNDLLDAAPAPPCPVVGCAAHSDDLAGAIIHLNDDHHWPREETADWLESLGL